MGRPTEVPGTPMTGLEWDPRSRALVSESPAAEVSEPAWGLSGPQDASADGVTVTAAGLVATAAEGAPAETAEGAPAEAAPQIAPAEAARQSAPAEAAPQATPAETAPQSAPERGAHASLRAPEIAHAAPQRKLSTGRRGPADPVKSLMHRHRELCERAVDPLEIAAGLEAHGVTDRTAARYRHRDVFSLAEELFARVPGFAGEPAGAVSAPAHDIRTRAAWSLRALLPGAACLATLVALRLTEGVLGGEARLAIGSGGTLLAFTGLALALHTGPLSGGGRSAGAANLYCCWLLGYALYGEALLHQVLSGGPEGPWAITPAPLLGLAVAVAPAAWCAHLFSVHAQRKLNGSRALEEFAAGVRPLLFGAVAFFFCALIGLLYLAGLGTGDGGAPVGAVGLGVLLLLARLLTVHGFPEPAAAGLAAACAVEAAAPALVLAGRLPGLDAVARPVDALVAAAGTGAVPAVACGAAALGLLITATVALSRASAHTAV
ncbi:hypothetical protein OG244_13065 [Streptomyces brevispora]|uniref:hypothetical protein n=1 Tax=Streptomyces brevispora TaxID=887462 RepID=UPI002E34D12F|nr:hypothetical protein [Streptomyces brevispora]